MAYSAQYGSYSVPVKGSTINVNNAGKEADVDLISKIFTSSMISRENIKYSQYGNQVVPSTYLDYKSNIPKFYLGTSKSLASATTVYNQLLTLTRWLLKVGTFSYYEYREKGKYRTAKDKEWRLSGTALFTDDYTVKQIGKIETATLTPVPANGGVLKASLLSVESLKQLATNCYNSWRDSKRPHYERTFSYCHSNCHSNCHSKSHSNSGGGGSHDNCHGFACHGNGAGYNNAGHGGYNSNT